MRVLERHARDVEAAGDGAHLLVGELVDAADGLVDGSHDHVLQHIDVLGIEGIGIDGEVDELHLAVDGHLDGQRRLGRRRGAAVRRIAACAVTATTTATGLQFEDTIVGGSDEARKGQNVTVHYTGWLYNNGVQGAKFDSSKDRNDPFVFSLGAGMVIRGWDEGVQGMKIGGARTLIIPAELGYGARGAGGVIPPNATLKFDVELLGVK